ncbi:MAG: cryptochrome/photolyase family protein [Gemmatimonadota bacterium]|jgi:deoxyribodipyrimidine photolyase-related protein
MSASPTLRFILGDQLTRSVSSLTGLDPERDVVLMAEVPAECTYVGHHKKKIAFILSAMRHFAAELEAEGIRVDYRTLDTPDNQGDFLGELKAAIRRHRASRVIVTEPGEWRVREDMGAWEKATGVPVEIRLDDRFLASRDGFAAWAQGRKSLRMEYFYREMRKETGLLMGTDGKPEGGKWNYDKANRKRLPKGVVPPPPLRHSPDSITREVMALVDTHFPHHFGSLEPFWFAVSANQARQSLEQFLAEGLPGFGHYQDAMKEGEPILYHAVIGLYLNTGLLDPLDVCRKAEQAYCSGHAPLNAVEGFIRQIIGWREYIRGIYWLKMPAYAETNSLEAHRRLPGFYWTGDTEMNCLRQCILQTREEAYAHHIQRLMVTGNFALLAGLAPVEVEEWYLSVYADAFEWVELPNTHGMALFADGGILGSKPYAASGKYIHRMSDYCAGCRYDVKETAGPMACPFNFLYWDFLARHRDKLENNPRMGLVYNALDRMDPEHLTSIRSRAGSFLENLR